MHVSKARAASAENRVQLLGPRRIRWPTRMGGLAAVGGQIEYA